jgi:hypothetical protein
MARLRVLVPALRDFDYSCKGKSSTVTSVFLYSYPSVSFALFGCYLIASSTRRKRGHGGFNQEHDIIRCGS